MKNNILLVLFISICFHFSEAQIHVGKIKWSKSVYLDKPAQLKQEDFNKIKNAKTFFVYDEDVYKTAFSKSEFQNIIKETWKVTDYEVIMKSDILQKVKIGDALVYFTYDILTGSGTSSADNTRIDFGILKEYKKKKIDLDVYSNMYIKILPEESFIKLRKGEKFIFKLNIGKSQFANYVRFINNKLDKNESYISWGDFSQSEIKNIRKDTLYFSYFGVSKRTLEQVTIDGNTKDQIDAHFEKKVFKKANFNFKVLTEKELSDLIEKKRNNKEKIYYLVSYPRYGFKIAKVYDVDGEVIFRNYQGSSFWVNKKDIKDLNKAIETGSF